MRSFCIVGLGCFGMALTNALLEKKLQVMVISEDAEAVNAIADRVTSAVIGDPTSEAVLRSSGAVDYDCAVVCIDDNMSDSILATMILKELGVAEVVARAMNERHKRILTRVGADMTVFPEEDMGDRLAQVLAKKDVLEYFSFSDDYSIVEMHVPKDWVGRSMIDIHIRHRYGVTVVAVRHAGGRLDPLPSPDALFEEGDTITVVGTDDRIEKLTKRLQ